MFHNPVKYFMDFFTEKNAIIDNISFVVHKLYGRLWNIFQQLFPYLSNYHKFN